MSLIAPNPPVAGFSASALPFNNGQILEGWGGAFSTSAQGPFTPGNIGSSTNLLEPSNAITAGKGLYRIQYPAAGAGTSCGWMQPNGANNYFLRRSAGWGIAIQFAIPGTLPANTIITFAANDSGNANFTTNISTQNCGLVGLGCDSGDANWQIVKQTATGSGDFTKTDTGFSKTSAEGMYMFAIQTLAGSSSYQVWLYYLPTGSTSLQRILTAQTISGGIPAINTGLQLAGQLSSATVSLSICFIYDRWWVPFPASLPAPF
jgi:hypothetical protein